MNDLTGIFASRPNNRTALAAARPVSAASSEHVRAGRAAVSRGSRDIHAPPAKISAALKPFSVMIGAVHLN